MDIHRIRLKRTVYVLFNAVVAMVRAAPTFAQLDA